MIYLGCDHRGLQTLKDLMGWLSERGHLYNIVGKMKLGDQWDYPDSSHSLAQRVGPEDLGVLICYTGNGMAMSANKHSHIRAALCWNAEIATLAKQHNDANVLCLPAGFMSSSEILRTIETFINTKFEGGRHLRRVQRIPAQN